MAEAEEVSVCIYDGKFAYAPGFVFGGDKSGASVCREVQVFVCGRQGVGVCYSDVCAVVGGFRNVFGESEEVDFD